MPGLTRKISKGELRGLHDVARPQHVGEVIIPGEDGWCSVDGFHHRHLREHCDTIWKGEAIALLAQAKLVEVAFYRMQRENHYVVRMLDQEKFDAVLALAILNGCKVEEALEELCGSRT